MGLVLSPACQEGILVGQRLEEEQCIQYPWALSGPLKVLVLIGLGSRVPNVFNPKSLGDLRV